MIPVRANDRAVDPGAGHVNSAVFDFSFRTCAPALRAYVRKLVHCSHTSEEIVQDVFLNVWVTHQHCGDFDALTGYLYKSAKHRALDVLRRRRLEQKWVESATRDPSVSDPPRRQATDDGVYAAELEVALRKAVDALPTRCRLIFTLHREHELSYAEIAQRLGLSVKTVENQMGRALKGIRRKLQPLT